MPNFMLAAATPLIIGPLTFVVMQGCKALSATVDALPPIAKRIAVLVIATALTLLGSWAGVDFQCSQDAATNCLATLDKDAVKAVVAAAISFLLHVAKQNKAP